MPRPPKQIPKDVVFHACEQLVAGVSATEVAKFVSREIRESFSREQVYPLLRKARELGLLRMVAPIDKELTQWLAALPTAVVY